jgi:hypothetical protein
VPVVVVVVVVVVAIPVPTLVAEEAAEEVWGVWERGVHLRRGRWRRRMSISAVLIIVIAH